MKTKCLLLSFFFFGFLLTNAQFKQIAAGPEFEEPDGANYAKLLLMKNGGVMFFRIGINDNEIDVKIYNAAHKEKVNNSCTPSYGKLKSSALENVFEINGDAVLMISEQEHGVPLLYRLIIDGTTGKLKKEEKIAELKRVTMGMGYAAYFGGVPLPDFYVSKDPDSDNYAVVLFNSFESDRDKRIEIVLYGNDHKEISRAYYASPDEKYKYLEFISMAVMGAEKVSVLVNGYNSGGKDREVILATLKKGATAVSFDQLPFPQDSVLENGIVRYNPGTKRLIVAAKIHARKNTKEAYTYIGILDPETGKAEKVVQSGLNEEVNKRAADIFGRKYKYFGAPVDLYINNDGGFSVTYEEQVSVTESNGRYSTTHIETYNIAVATYTQLGELKSSYIIPKNFWIDGQGSLTYHGGFGNQYKKFAYINGATKSYILINDTRRNIERLEKDKDPIQIQAVSDCDAFYFPLTGKDPIPERKYLFGEPEDKKERNLAPLGLSTYDKVNDVFIALRLTKEGRDKSVNVVWLKPQ